MPKKALNPATRGITWITGAALFGTATALLLGLAHLFAWLSRVQINYLAN